MPKSWFTIRKNLNKTLFVFLLINLINASVVFGQTIPFSGTQQIDICTTNCLYLTTPNSLKIYFDNFNSLETHGFVSNQSKNILFASNINQNQEFSVIDARWNGGFELWIQSSDLYQTSNGQNTYNKTNSPKKLSFQNLKILSFNKDNNSSVDGNSGRYFPVTSTLKPFSAPNEYTYQTHINNVDSANSNFYNTSFSGSNEISDAIKIMDGNISIANIGRIGKYSTGLGFIFTIPNDTPTVLHGIDGVYSLELYLTLIDKPAE